MQIHKVRRESDLELMVPVFIKAFSTEPYNESWTLKRAYNRLRENYARDLLNVCHFYATEDQSVVGMISGITQTWNDGIHVVGQELAVAADQQGKGIGSALVLASMLAAEKKGCVSFAGEALRGAPAYEFWKRCGATYTGFEHFKIPIS